MAIDERSEALESSAQALEKAVNISEVPDSPTLGRHKFSHLESQKYPSLATYWYCLEPHSMHRMNPH